MRQFRAFDRAGVEAELAVPAHWQVTTMAAFGVPPAGAGPRGGGSAPVRRRQRCAAEEISWPSRPWPPWAPHEEETPP